jgi:hypothetical protein
MTYEDFVAAWKKSQQPAEPNRRPRYSIESIEIDGREEDGHAALDFTATVQLQKDGPIDVPMGLVGAIVHGQPTFGPRNAAAPKQTDRIGDKRELDAAGSSQDALINDPEHGGFVAQLDGRAGDRRTVALRLIVPLRRDGAEVTLQLGFPRALDARLEMDVESANPDASVSSGTLLRQQPTDDGGTRLEAAGMAGPFRLSWRAGDNGRADLTTVLSAEGAVRVSIDGRSVRSDARLTVQSFGGRFERFRVRLPAGAQLLHSGPDELDLQKRAYRLSIDEKAGSRVGDDSEDRQVVLVEMMEGQRPSATVELSTEQPIGIKGSSSSVALAGFEVLGAVRQFGDVALEVAEDWQARWDFGPNVRQVDPRELESSLQHPGLTAAFQYDRQPWSLDVSIAGRRSRVHVTPKYELECLPDEARLSVHLVYQVFGGRAFEFRIATNGWELSGAPLESGGLVDQDRISVDADGTLVLPLAQASTQRAEVSFTVRRDLPQSDGRIQLPMPLPLADSVGTGELIVHPSTIRELRPDLQSSSGLTSISATEAIDESGQVNGAELRYRTLTPEALFVADQISRAQEVSAQIVTEVDIVQTAADIVQRVRYDVKNDPIRELLFEVPSDVSLDEPPAEIALISDVDDGGAEGDDALTPLSWAAPTEQTEGPVDAATRNLRIVLPQPRLGRFAVRMRYQVPRPIDVSAKEAWQLPLIQPHGVTATDPQAIVRAPRNVAVTLDSNAEDLSWDSAATPTDSTETDMTYQYVANRPESFLPLVVTAVNFDLSTETEVHRVWLQTWYSTDLRQDRAVFRFHTAGTQAAIELPPQVNPDEIEVLLDGQSADIVSGSGGRIVVHVPSLRRNRGAKLDATLHTLELRWRQPTRSGLLTRHRITPPQLVGSAGLSQVYWQIVLPGDEQVVRSPARMTSASRWQWLGSFWGQRPAMSQQDLEEWSGASAQVAPAAGDNEYLFTGIAPAMSIQLVTAPRWLIVLTASSMVLILALIWIYVPIVHRSWLPVAIACLAAALAVVFPVPALLLAQASLLGVVGAVLSIFLARLMSKPSHWPVTVSGGSSRHITPRPDSLLMPPVAGGASTAPTVALRVQDSER